MQRDYPRPPFPNQPQPDKAAVAGMDPPPDHGEEHYLGTGRLAGKRALITGADSGIGRAVAIAFAREGADVVIGYHLHQDDAETTADWVRKAGARAETCRADIAGPEGCKQLVEFAVQTLGGIDVLVNNAAHQAVFGDLADIDDAEWEYTFAVNIHAMFRLTKALVPQMGKGSAIINTASINADKPNPKLLAYAATKGAIQNFTAGLAQMLAERGVRVNCVAPGPVWTPLIPSSFGPEEVRNFGEQTPFKRPAQPAELAAAYVYLASDEASYVSGATIAVTGASPML